MTFYLSKRVDNTRYKGKSMKKTWEFKWWVRGFKLFPSRRTNSKWAIICKQRPRQFKCPESYYWTTWMKLCQKYVRLKHYLSCLRSFWWLALYRVNLRITWIIKGSSTRGYKFLILTITTKVKHFKVLIFLMESGFD